MIVMSEEQNVNEQDRTGGNGADQNPPHVLHAGGEDQQQHGQDGQPHVLHAGGEDQQQHGQDGQPHVLHAGGEDQQQHGQDGQPHVLHAGGEDQQQHGQDGQPHVLHAGGEDQQQHGQDGQPHVLHAGGDGQQAQGGKGQAEEAAKRVVRAKATVGSAARLAQNGLQAPLQAIDVKALSQSLDSVVQSGLVLTKGGQQAWTQWVDYSGHATHRNVRAFNELVRVRSIGGLISWQTEVMKAN